MASLFSVLIRNQVFFYVRTLHYKTFSKNLAFQYKLEIRRVLVNARVVSSETLPVPCSKSSSLIRSFAISQMAAGLKYKRLFINFLFSNQSGFSREDILNMQTCTVERKLSIIRNYQ